MTDSSLPATPETAQVPGHEEIAKDLIAAVRARTPARVLVGRAGLAYRTGTYLELRRDHAAALDAVQAELFLERDFDADFAARWQLFETCTQAGDKHQFLLRPDLGRRFDDASRAAIAERCPAGADLQIAIADGLSAAAVMSQVPLLLPLLSAEAQRSGLQVGQPFLIRYCRVGILNEIGELLNPSVAVLLIGERPGLATAQSLSAYMAYRPRAGHSDAQRNLISNIHPRGVAPQTAARRIVALAQKMRAMQSSGVHVKEEFGC